MPGPTPITASHRVTFLYTVAGLQHHQRNYCTAIASADPTGYDLVGVQIPGGVPLSTVADPLFTKLAPFYKNNNCTLDGLILEHRSGTTWIFDASTPTAAGPAVGSGNVLASGFCLSGKDTTNQNFPVYFYEGIESGPVKSNSFGALSGAEQALIDAYWNTGGGGVAVDPWNWRLSRGTAHPQRWLALVVDSNEKLRRLRRLK
jgi:hypothetical protein